MKNLKTNSKYLVSIAFIVLLCAIMFNSPLTKSLVTSNNQTCFHISVIDSAGNSPNNTNVYVFSNPSTPSWSLIYNASLLSGQYANVLVKPGNYSVGAHQDDIGWAVKPVNVTSDEGGMTVPMLLTLEPLATNYIDSNGTVNHRLTSWTFMKSLYITRSNESDLKTFTNANGPAFSNLKTMDNQTLDKLISGATSNSNPISSSLGHAQPDYWNPPPQQWNFLWQGEENEQMSYDIPTAIGGLYTTAGVTNSLTMGVQSDISVGYWASDGVVSYNGGTQFSSSSDVQLGSVPLANGQTQATLWCNYDYDHEEWLVEYFIFLPPAGYYTYYVTYETIQAVNPSSPGALPYMNSATPPSPLYNPIYSAGVLDWADVNVYPPSQQNLALTYTTSNIQSDSWSVTAACSVMPDWIPSSGSLGASYTWSNVNGGTTTENIYVQGGRQILVSQAMGQNSPLTLQNDYWMNGYVSQTPTGVGNANAMISENNNNGGRGYTQLYAGNSGDVAAVTYTAGNNANQEYASGHIYIYGNEVSGYYQSELLVYVSNNTQTWTQIGQVWVYTGTSFIDCGSTSNHFKYVAVAAYDDPQYGWSANVQLYTAWIVSPN